ncbi:hypothetical protein [Pseudomonas sp. 13B_3.2_Bac1]|uniref:hypothetical protein n=1 Tax=Pseudomonas sp. 13B_3.2_Bac1 TaxID=2971623 RepID=UPI0021C714D5|nr:hypothetical protein [Pseudomonas sp. 13B_3.2_Bac1]MCU1772187.1 hypothetical protein [Pseudomonas sp. 13B_3.2_Bac1]
MQNSNKSEEQIFNLINKNQNQFEGTFSASVDGEKFMFADENVLFYRAERDYFIVGSDNEDENYVTFCVQQHLVKEGPHNVEKYEGGLIWSVKIKDRFHVVQQGHATVTFLQRGEYRYGAFGDIDFVLPDGRKITGEFDIKRRE